MGYEMKFYIVRKSNLALEKDEPKKWAEKISEFYYCNDYGLANWIDNNYGETSCYIFADDDNTEILEDMYGSPLIEIPIKDMIEYLETHSDDYRRVKPFLYMLKAFDEDNEVKWNNELVILKYGY